MRRVLLILTIAALTAGTFAALAGPASAQTDGDLAAFCAGRIEANSVEGKAANLAIMNRLIGAAPSGVKAQITALRDAYQKKGDKLFNSEQGLTLLGALDTWVYDNCPGKQVAVTAIDYQFDGVPTSLPAGVTKFKLTNNAPKELHEMGIVKLTDAATGQDLKKILSLPEKQQAKYFDDSSSTFMFAPPGQSGYGPINLEPGTYAYACFIPQGGKKNGTPHFMLGMNGTFTVQ